MLLNNKLINDPAQGLPGAFGDGKKAAEQSHLEEFQAITEELAKLYSLLESGAINELQFDEYERHLLDRMDQLDSQAQGASGDESNKVH